MCFTPFDAKYCNSLPDIDTVSKRDLSASIDALKPLIFKHGLSDIVACSRTHKHIDFKDQTERSVASVVVSARNIKEFSVTFRQVDESELKHLIPYSFALDPSTRAWREVAHFDTRGVGAEHMDKSLSRVLAKPDFLAEAAKLLLAQPDPGLLGLSIRFQDLVTRTEGEPLLESTDHKARTQWFCPKGLVNVPDKTLQYVQTHWYWKAGGLEEDGCACADECVIDRGGHFGYRHWGVHTNY
eukprot:CAMPEP_0175115094 /NCGR_PEP_ID=MMETSP0086_2-20121207/17307_1 /TAXON_ID=136419 /ORGANISM="Unknown Unknown, Strain D1" /LENGTH=240 /DNA_ID=CAMNT_0016394989 /DNA_START=50 /DNA_END=772 /DNA_ORIENTATION=-